MASSAPLPDNRDPDEFLRYEPEAKKRLQRVWRHPAYWALTELQTFLRDALAGTDEVTATDMASALRDRMSRLVRHVDLVCEDLERDGYRDWVDPRPPTIPTVEGTPTKRIQRGKR